MSHLDILNLYNDYKKLGKTDEEAMLHIKALDINTLDFVTKSEFSLGLEKIRSDIKQDFNELKSEFSLIKSEFLLMKNEFKWMWKTIIGTGFVLTLPILKSIFEWLLSRQLFL